MTRGYMIAPEADHPHGTLTPWESLVVDAVGNVIEFWGFKANQGRVWAWLYVHGKPRTAAEMQVALGLSKGAVSMVTRELEGWGVLRRVRRAGSASWCFEAETDLMRMVARVIADREAQFIARVERDLEEALHRVKAAPGVHPDVIQRIQRMRALAQLTGRAVQGFLRTARLDVRAISNVLTAPLRRVRRS
jgi:HTH-type transcriptional regulator, glycine betaine synthesis regulator